MISLSRVGVRLRRRNHRPQVIHAVIYLRYCAWRTALLDADLDNLEDIEEWHRIRPKTMHLTRVLPGVDTMTTVTMPTVRMDG